MTNRGPRILNTIKKYGTNLFGFIRGRVRSQEEAEDILQEVWYQLSRIVDLEEIENISGWLYRVARNKITDRFRKNEPALIGDRAIEDDALEDILGFLASEAETPEDILVKELFWEQLMNALDELPENQRSVFIRNELEAMTLQEISDQEGEKLKTIISRKRYAVQHLRKRMQALYNELNN